MDNGNGNTCFVGASGTSATVGIYFHIVRQIVVNHVCKVAYIQSSRCHIGSYQQLQVADAEFLHYRIALCLREVAVKRVRVVAIVHQFIRHLFGFLTGAAKHNAVNIGIQVHNTFQHQIALARLGNIIDVFHVFVPGIACANGDFIKITHILAGNAGNFGRHRRGKKQGATGFGRFLQYGFNVFFKTHVQHFVRLVKNQKINVSEFYFTSFGKVNESAGRSYNDLGRAVQLFELLTDVFAAVHRYNADFRQILSIVFQVVGNLYAKFSRGRQHQCLYLTFLQVNHIKDRQPESGCFSGSGLC